MLKRSLILFSCALIAGLAVGWNHVDAPPPATREAMEKSPSHISPPHPVWTTEDFIEFSRNSTRVMRHPGYNPLAQILADWTDAEIISALNASLTNPDVVLSAGSAKYLDLHLLNEWTRRDFDSALAWFEKLESRSAKSRLAHTIGKCWPADKAEEGLAFLQANRELFPSTLGDPIVNTAFEAAARNGPAAVEKVLKILRESEIAPPLESWSFPPDFDFATLSRSKEVEVIWRVFLDQWLAQDSDQVFDWALEFADADSLGELFRRSQDSKWIGTKFETLDAGKRAGFMDKIKSAGSSLPPVEVADFLEGVRDPTVLQGAYEMLSQNLLRGNVETHMEVLEQIGDTEIRISLLKNAPPTEMNDADESLLRLKLAEWKASPAQIQSILSRYKP